MQDLDTLLTIYHDRGRRRLPLQRIYRQLYNPEIFLRAYGNIYSNNGATIPGADPSDTVDGMSVRKIENIISELKNGVFQWKPSRRVYIPKRDGRKRPLSVPGWTDKLVQEAIRMLLEAYYEPQFSQFSHGFRPGRGCHTALAAIETTFRGIAWFIEGDIKGCFDNIDHEILLDILSKNIHDERFIRLMRKLLEAGYVDDWKYYGTYSGTPQGGVISPLLSNIFLNQLDKFVENELIPAHQRGHVRPRDKEYARIAARMRYAFKRGDVNEGLHWRKLMYSTPSQNPCPTNYRRLKYIRYCDDFILGFAGPKAEAKEIRVQLADFLSSIGLELSLKKTKITHTRTETSLFLGYEMRVMQNDTYRSKLSDGRTKRSINGGIWLGIPRQVVTETMRKYTRNGKAIHRAERLVNEPFTIVSDYQSEYRGLAQYYVLAHNRSHRLSKLRIVMTQSLGKTLAAKLGISHAEVFRRYMTEELIDGQIRKVLQVRIPREGKPDLVAMWGSISLARIRQPNTITDTISRIWSTRTELVERLLADTCEICGSQENIEVHHVRKLADLNRPGRRAKSLSAQKMMARRRKTLVVCHDCHVSIHKGDL
jgi:group II intron reverse transcriptase/maturase